MRRVLITGAAGSAGGGVLDAFAAGDWQITGLTRSRRPAEAAEAADVGWVTADLGDEAATQTAVAAAMGGLDALVCLAGGFRLTPVDDAGWPDYATLIDLDYRPTVVAVLASLPHLAEGGTIVTVGARTAHAPGPRSGGYAAAKAAVIAFSASLAVELRPRRIRVNCVLPGTIDTPANRKAMRNAKTANWVQPRQLGELIRFLAGPESEPLSGAAIPIG